MRALLLASVVVLAACGSVPSPSPSPGPSPILSLHFKAVLEGTIDGKITAYLESVPVLKVLEIKGTGTLTLQFPDLPHVTTDGSITVVPLPGHEAEAQQAYAEGKILIRRGGAMVGFGPATEAPVGPPPPPQEIQSTP